MHKKLLKIVGEYCTALCFFEFLFNYFNLGMSYNIHRLSASGGQVKNRGGKIHAVFYVFA